MPHVLTMPGVADCEAGMIARWYKQPGDRVLRGEPLVELTFSSAARPKLQLKQATTKHDSIAHLIDPAVTFRLIRTESDLNITTTTAVARTIHMVVAADIDGILRSIVDTTGQPIQPGRIIAQFASEMS
jgi:hypothetical protein